VVHSATLGHSYESGARGEYYGTAQTAYCLDVSSSSQPARQQFEVDQRRPKTGEHQHHQDQTFDFHQRFNYLRLRRQSHLIISQYLKLQRSSGHRRAHLRRPHQVATTFRSSTRTFTTCSPTRTSMTCLPARSSSTRSSSSSYDNIFDVHIHNVLIHKTVFHKQLQVSGVTISGVHPPCLAPAVAF